MMPCSADAPVIIDELDEPQATLLYWGPTVPWTWEKFNDPRTLQFEAAVKLVSFLLGIKNGKLPHGMRFLKTSNWVYHLGNSAAKPNDGCPLTEDDVQLELYTSTRTLQHALHLSPNASVVALFVRVSVSTSLKFTKLQ